MYRKNMQTNTYKSKTNTSIRHAAFYTMTCLILVTGILLSSIAGSLLFPLTVNAASTKSAKKAFKNFLAEGKWGEKDIVGTYNNPSALSFYYTTVGKNKTPILIAQNSEAIHADGYVRVFQYVNGKVSCVCANDGLGSFYKKAGVIETAHTGGGYNTEDLSYHKLDKNNILKLCAFSAILHKEYFANRENYDYVRKLNGPDVYKIGNKKVTKAKFNSYIKKIKKGNKDTRSKIKFRKNTAANRKKYLG